MTLLKTESAMTLHQLRIFDAVARHLNITNASAELHMSQPAVTTSLNSWNNGMGDSFTERLDRESL